MLNLARSVSHNPADGLSESDFMLLGNAPSHSPNTATSEGDFHFFGKGMTPIKSPDQEEEEKK